MNFQHPWIAYLLLLLIPLLAMQLWLVRFRNRQIKFFAESSLLRRILHPRLRAVHNTKVVCSLLIWFFLVAALMDPFGNSRYANTFAENEGETGFGEVIFLVDTSASMGVKDGYDGQSRLQSAKLIMENMLQEFHGETVALYAFTSQLTLLVPPTLDYIFTRISIHDLTLNEGGVGGTLFAPVLSALQTQVFSRPTARQVTLVLFSDGGDTSSDETTILQALAPSDHLHLLAVGIGGVSPQVIPNVTDQGKEVTSALQAPLLQELAHKWDGKYFQASEWSAWSLSFALIEQIKQEGSLENVGRKKHAETLASGGAVIFDRYFQIPLALALLFYFIVLFLPESSGKVALSLLFIFSLPLQADEDFNSTRLQGLIDAKEFDQAETEISSLKSLSLSPWQKARLRYNEGTLLLAKGEWVAALFAFKDIKAETLALPLFASGLFLNEGIAYIRYASALSLPLPLLYDAQELYITYGLGLIHQAQEVQCTGGGACTFSPRIADWVAEGEKLLAEAKLKKSEVNEKDEPKREVIIALEETLKASGDSLLLLIRHGMVEGHAPQSQDELRKAEDEALAKASLFIPAVLREQEKNYQTSCLDVPWDGVIPLFSTGVSAEKEAKELLSHATTSFDEVIAYQMEATLSFSKALELLKHPPKNVANAQEEKRENALGKIQEMFLQDQPAQPTEPKDLHAW